MDKISYKVIFNRKKKTNAEGKALIQIECYLNGKRKYISTGIKLKPENWNNKAKRIKNNHPEYSKLNRMINKQLRAIEDFEFERIEKNGSISLPDLDMIKEGNTRGSDFLKFCFESL